MAVVLTDGLYWVRKRAHEYTRDAHGIPVAPAPGQAIGPWPGAATEQTTEGSYTLRLDPAAWPLRADDLVDGPDGKTYLIETAVLRVNEADPAVDYVQIVASLQPPRRI